MSTETRVGHCETVFWLATPDKDGHLPRRLTECPYNRLRYRCVVDAPYDSEAYWTEVDAVLARYPGLEAYA